MVKRCIVCQERIRTGSKYCWRHRLGNSPSIGGLMERQLKAAERKRNNYILLAIIIVFFLYPLYWITKIGLSRGENVSLVYFLFFILIIAIIGLFYLAHKNHIKARALYKEVIGDLPF